MTTTLFSTSSTSAVPNVTQPVCVVVLFHFAYLVRKTKAASFLLGSPHAKTKIG